MFCLSARETRARPWLTVLAVTCGGRGVESVVFVAFGGMREDFVGFDDFAETFCGMRRGGVVGVVLFYEVEVLFFDFFGTGVAGEIEDFVG